MFWRVNEEERENILREKITSLNKEIEKTQEKISSLQQQIDDVLSSTKGIQNLQSLYTNLKTEKKRLLSTAKIYEKEVRNWQNRLSSQKDLEEKCRRKKEKVETLQENIPKWEEEIKQMKSKEKDCAELEKELKELKSQKKAAKQNSKMLQQKVEILQKKMLRQDQLSEELRMQQNQYSAKLKELIREWTDKLQELEQNKQQQQNLKADENVTQTNSSNMEQKVSVQSNSSSDNEENSDPPHRIQEFCKGSQDSESVKGRYIAAKNDIEEQYPETSADFKELGPEDENMQTTSESKALHQQIDSPQKQANREKQKNDYDQAVYSKMELTEHCKDDVVPGCSHWYMPQHAKDKSKNKGTDHVETLQKKPESGRKNKREEEEEEEEEEEDDKKKKRERSKMDTTKQTVDKPEELPEEVESKPPWFFELMKNFEEERDNAGENINRQIADFFDSPETLQREKSLSPGDTMKGRRKRKRTRRRGKTAQ